MDLRSCRAPAAIDTVDVGQQEEAICIDLTGKQSTGMILVDYRFDAVQAAVVGTADRNAAASDADDDDTARSQERDHAEPENCERPRGGHGPAPGGAVLHDRPAPLGRKTLRLVLRVDGADRLCGSGEGGILRIDDELRED